MTSRDLLARDAGCVWHPYTQHATDTPLPVVSAEGAWLELADGRKLLDGISSWWTCLHGHAEPAIVEAMHEQARRLDHVLFAGATHPAAVELAERLVEITPDGLSRVFFSDNGSTAVEVALKMVCQSWLQIGEQGRATFLAFDGSYHGDTCGAMSVGDPDPFFAAYRPMLFDVRRVAPDIDAVDAALEELGDQAAGLIVEPLVQGAGGMRFHAAEVLRGIAEACTRHGVPWIADEVMTGFGRTGSLFACAAAGVTPDLMCLSKGLTGGVLPLAVTLAHEPMFEAFLAADRSKMFFHGHSFTANPIACAVANASTRLVVERDVPARLREIGVRIENALREGLPPSAPVENVRRLGGIVAADMQTSESGYLAQCAATVRATSIEHGVLLRPLGNVVYAMPPAATSDDEADTIGRAMAASITAALATR